MAKSILQAILKLRKVLRKYRRELVLGILVSSVFASSWITFREQKIIQRIINRRSEKEQKLDELQQLMTQYPDSRDLLYRQALLEWELGNEQEASAAIDRARYLDPNNPTLQSLNELQIQHSQQ